MIPVWWSVLLTALGGLGWLLVTVERRVHGFLVGLAAQAAWISYAVTTRQWGFIGSALLFGAINALGLWRWWRARPKPPCARCRHGHDRHGVNDFGDPDCVGPDVRTSCDCDGYTRTASASVEP